MIAHFIVAVMASAEVMKSHDHDKHPVEAYYEVSKMDFVASAKHNLARNKEAVKYGISSHEKDFFKKEFVSYSEENIEGSLVITCPEGSVECDSGCCTTEYTAPYYKCDEGLFYGEKCWVPSSFAYECPTDYEVVGDLCKYRDVVDAEILCPERFVYVPEEDICVSTTARDGFTCPPDFELEGDLCVSYEELEPVCPDGYELVDETECVRLVESDKCINGHAGEKLQSKDHGSHLRKLGEKLSHDEKKYEDKKAGHDEKLSFDVKKHKTEKVLTKIFPRGDLPTMAPKSKHGDKHLVDKKHHSKDALEAKKAEIELKKEALKREKTDELAAKKAELELKKIEKRDELEAKLREKEDFKREKMEEARIKAIRLEEKKDQKREETRAFIIAKKELEAAKKEAIENAKAEKYSEVVTEKYAYEAWIKSHPKFAKDGDKGCTFVEVIGATQPIVEVVIPPTRGEVPENLVAEPTTACPFGYTNDGDKCYYSDVQKRTRLCDGLVVGNKECRTEAPLTVYCPKGWNLLEDVCARDVDVIGTWTWIRGFQCVGSGDACSALYDFIKTEPHGKKAEGHEHKKSYSKKKFAGDEPANLPIEDYHKLEKIAAKTEKIANKSKSGHHDKDYKAKSGHYEKDTKSKAGHH